MPVVVCSLVRARCLGMSVQLFFGDLLVVRSSPSNSTEWNMAKEKKQYVYMLRRKSDGLFATGSGTSFRKKGKIWKRACDLKSHLGYVYRTRSTNKDLRVAVHLTSQREKLKAEFEILEIELTPSRTIEVKDFYPEIDLLK